MDIGQLIALQLPIHDCCRLFKIFALDWNYAGHIEKKPGLACFDNMCYSLELKLEYIKVNRTTHNILWEECFFSQEWQDQSSVKQVKSWMKPEVYSSNEFSEIKEKCVKNNWK